MKTLQVFEKNNNIVVDSRQVAQMVGKRHKNLIRDIDKYNMILTSSNLSPLTFFIESTYKDEKGEIRPCYLLTKKGCDMVANKLIGEKGVLFTANYINAFYEMECLLLQKQTQDWQTARQLGKLTRRSETDVIKEFIEYAKQQGSKNADKYYINFSKLANKIAGVDGRELASARQLSNLDLVENILLNCIKEGIAKNLTYKAIYQFCKDRLENVARLAYISA